MFCARLMRCSLTGSSEAVRTFASHACIAGDDPAGGDVSHSDLLSIRTYDVLENPIAVEEGISEMVADDDTVVADAGEFRVAVHHLSVIQRSKGAVAIDESVINSAAIAGIHVDANHHAVVVEGSRK